MVSADAPRRREVWLVALGAGRAGEPGKTRPAIVVSSDEAGTGAPGELIVVVPLSSSVAPSGLRVDVPPMTGIDRPSRAVCRAIRAVVSSRFVRRIGSVDPATMQQTRSGPRTGPRAGPWVAARVIDRALPGMGQRALVDQTTRGHLTGA